MNVGWVSGNSKMFTISILHFEQHLNNVICQKKDINSNWKRLLNISDILVVYGFLYF